MYAMRTRSTTEDGRVIWMRLVNRKVLRRAMQATKGTDRDVSSIPKLAYAAQVSTALIGFLVTDGKSARETTTYKNAVKIAEAVGWDLDELFVEESSTVRTSRTDTLSDGKAA